MEKKFVIMITAFIVFIFCAAFCIRVDFDAADLVRYKRTCDEAKFISYYSRADFLTKKAFAIKWEMRKNRREKQNAARLEAKRIYAEL